MSEAEKPLSGSAMSDDREVISASALELTELAAEIIGSGGSVELFSRGNSMKPMLTFDRSLVRLVAPGTPLRGDVVLYRYPDGRCIMHRIVSSSGDGSFVCRGDNNLWTERGVRAEWIIAKVSAFTWHGRWVSAEAPAYRLYWRLWLGIWPLRKFYKRALRKLKRVIFHRKEQS